MKEQLIKISVRNFVEFLLRSGDIDNRVSDGGADAMQIGARLHRKIQKSMGAAYTAEVALKQKYDLDGFSLQLEGRADGLIREESGVTIDEIKGVFTDLSRMTEPVSVHLAQAKCYAAILAAQEKLAEITVQMTYCNMETEAVRRFTFSYPQAELAAWLQELLTEYRKWAAFSLEWGAVRNASLKTVEFPYAYRQGQKTVAESVYKTILRNKRLFIQAPTGVGKTMATVFPAVKAVGEGLGEKIFYLTAKTITRTVAWQAFALLRENGMQFKVVVLTAKDKICFMEESDCNPEYCPYAKGHYDRINEALYQTITTHDGLDRETLETEARKWQVCPFELSLDVALFMDGIICDYNYVFDPKAHLKRFFADNVKGEYIFLIDEAHNLVERGREMYSATLYKEQLLAVRKLVKEQDPRLTKALTKGNALMLEMKKECQDYQVLSGAANLYLAATRIMTEMERYLDDRKGQKAEDAFLELYFAIRDFLSVYENLDDHYLIYSETMGQGSFKVCLFCVNPAACLGEYMAKGVATILFSATFLPINYYKQLLSDRDDDYAIYTESPFAEENRLLVFGSDVNTKYTQRGEAVYRKYARYILTIMQARTGNYLAFFPSYKFMNEVYPYFAELCAGTDVEYALQNSYMSEEAREIFLENFEDEHAGSFVGFCVMGGIFSEGIDLVEDRLIGAIIVGTGLPQVGTERKLLTAYFDQHGLNGFEYAYLYPGMNKVLQSAGRVIRTETDKGVIALLDSRFLQSGYRATFPREWQTLKRTTVAQVEALLQTFWQQF